MNKKNESGRSMVEMLGVLAIVGVLSVAGIAGYSIAMRSHRTNEIVNAASMFYVLAKAQNAGNGPSGNIDYTDVGGTNPSGATLTYNNNAFTITFTDTDDCTMAANKLGDKATADCANKKITVNFGETVSAIENKYENFEGKSCNTEQKCYVEQYGEESSENEGKLIFCQVLECQGGKWEYYDEYSCESDFQLHSECVQHPACNTL